MKKIKFQIVLWACFAFSFLATSCAEQKNEQSEQTEKQEHSEEGHSHDHNHEHDHKHEKKSAEWKEMDDFHFVMAETFHPAEEGDFEPIKSKSEEMAKSAETWKNSTPPSEFDKPEIAEKLALLVSESAELDEFVKTNPSDEDLFKKLNALHDRFHEIMGACHHE